MEVVQTFLVAFATALGTAIVGLLWRVATEYVTNLRITRLTGVAGRAAGQILDSLAGDASLGDASEALMNEAVRYVRQSYPDTLKKLGSPTDHTLSEMIRGEMGRIQGGQTDVRTPQSRY